MMLRGPFQVGEKVQFTDRKAKRTTIQLVAGGLTQTDHGMIRHDDVIGIDPGSVITTVSAFHRSRDNDDNPSGASLHKTLKSARKSGGWKYTVMRPRMIDYSLSMPRGAQVMYPKDIAQAISLGDIRRGMRVVESGGGSGAMTLALIDAVGSTGSVTTIEMRPDFAQIVAANVELYYGEKPSWWSLKVNDFDSEAAQLADHSCDRIMFDMLDPWNRLEQASRIIVPGGVLIAYVTTTTQMSKLCEKLKLSGQWTEPEISELLERTWKADGLAVRPNHQMIGHTGFLVVSRAMAHNVRALDRRRRATKDVYTDIDSKREANNQETSNQEINKNNSDALSDSHSASTKESRASQASQESPVSIEALESLELRDISDRKVRKVLRDLTAQLKVLHEKNKDN